MDILPSILQISIQNLVPNDLKPGEEVILHASKKISATKIVYKHRVHFADGTKSAEIIWSKKSIKGERKQVNEALHAIVLALCQEGYFDGDRNALELFLKLKNKKELSFTPADLQKSLAVLMNKKRQEAPLLTCKTENARYIYTKTGS
ncbi:hypothetical protein [Pedobacter sp. GR22-6]|uniref:hypothetical protein n=1 Tax=Pedobacter sp. GR22-6 TaxID=3127957 RepID=UPI00307F4C0D